MCTKKTEPTSLPVTVLHFIASRYSLYTVTLPGLDQPHQGLFKGWEVFKP